MSAKPAPVAAIDHYENFPVASLLCPAHLRAPIAAIYHFARTADDLADEGEQTPAQRLADLAQFRAALQDPQAAAGSRWPQVFAPLHAAIRTHALPLPLLHDLLDAFVQDIEKTRDGTGYATEADLLDYCRRSANPVGRLLLHLYGVHSATAQAQSDAICTALQLANFWQDASVDLARGRCYFSEDMVVRFGVSRADLAARRQTPQATKMIAACVDSTRARMLQGAGLVHQVPGRAGWELRLVVQGGLRIMDKIRSMQYATLNRRPRIAARDYATLLWRALWM